MEVLRSPLLQASVQMMLSVGAGAQRLFGTNIISAQIVVSTCNIWRPLELPSVHRQILISPKASFVSKHVTAVV